MFKSKKEFAEALMSGRKFCVHSRDQICFYDKKLRGSPFKYKNSACDDIEEMNAVWDCYDIVTEYIYEPKPGEKVTVYDKGRANRHNAVFVCMWEGKYLCQISDEAFFSWSCCEPRP